jgi:hypothetical protein
MGPLVRTREFVFGRRALVDPATGLVDVPAGRVDFRERPEGLVAEDLVLVFFVAGRLVPCLLLALGLLDEVADDLTVVVDFTRRCVLVEGAGFVVERCEAVLFFVPFFVDSVAGRSKRIAGPGNHLGQSETSFAMLLVAMSSSLGTLRVLDYPSKCSDEGLIFLVIQS